MNRRNGLLRWPATARNASPPHAGAPRRVQFFPSEGTEATRFSARIEGTGGRERGDK